VTFSSVDPSSLQGEALSRWYLRSRYEIEQERQAAQAQNYEAFFGGIEPVDSPTASPRRAYQRSSAGTGDRPTWEANGTSSRRGRDQPAIRIGRGSPIETISVGRRVPAGASARNRELPHLPRAGSAAAAVPFSVSSGRPILSGYALGVLGRWLTEATLSAVRRSV